MDATSRIAAYQFITERLADALKLIGTANGAAFLAAIAAVNYFPEKPEMMEFLKKLSLTYLGGVFLFALSYFALMWFVMAQTPGLHGTTDYDPNFKSPSFIIALFLSGTSAACFFYASIRVGLMIASFSR